MSFQKNNAGLSITGTDFTFVELSFENEQTFLEHFYKIEFEEPLDFNSKESRFIASLQENFDKLKENTDIVTSGISVTLPPELFDVYSIPVDKKLVGDELKKQINWEFSVLFPTEDYNDFLFYQFFSDKLPRAIILGLKKNYAKKIHKFCVRNGIKLNLIDLANVAVNSFSDSDEKIAINLYYDNKTFSVIRLENNTIEYLKLYNIDSDMELATRLNDELVKFSEEFGDSIKNTKINLIGHFSDLDNLEELETMLDIQFSFLDPISFIVPKLSLEIPEEPIDRSMIAPAIAAAMRI